MGIWNALRRRYKAPEWALFSEVHDKTGWAQRGSADALAMNLWPSRGLALLGFEIKTDRRDWQRELARPEKAERFVALCDEWWVVTTPDVILDDSELPAGWGWLLLPKRGRVVAKNLKVKRKATPKEKQPELPRAFVAALLRRAHEMTENAELIKSAREEGYDEGFAEGRKKNEAQSEIRVLQSQLQHAEMQVKMYEEGKTEAGLGDFAAWDMKRIGRAVKMVMASSPNRLIASYERALRDLKGISSSLEAALAEVKDDLG